MKTFFISVLSLLTLSGLSGQETSPKISAKIYGFVRGDVSFDTRQNVSAFEGLFLLYPKDINEDANGEDLNAVANSGFYSFNSRAGLDISGLKAFNADITAKMEADFAGFGSSFGSNYSVLRIRQAYIKMKWHHSNLIAGQTWHPLFSPVAPDVISLSVGAPFNPFNRSPQLRYDYMAGKFTLSGAAIYQFQFTSGGPVGKTNIYQRNTVLPELFAGVDYGSKGFKAGAGINYLTITPRTQSSSGGDVYKVDENLSSLSYTAYVKYAINLFCASAKTIYGQNLSEQTMLGGYGISSIDAGTGKQEYTNFNHTTTWINLTYGGKYKGGIFAGYTKNLGTDKALVASSPLYGDGLTLDKLYRLSATFTYNIPHFMLGAEYEMTTAGYGDDFNSDSGKYRDSHFVTNHRIVGVISYLF